MKKEISIILVLLLIMLLAACSSKSENTTTTTTDCATEEPALSAEEILASAKDISTPYIVDALWDNFARGKNELVGNAYSTWGVVYNIQSDYCEVLFGNSLEIVYNVYLPNDELMNLNRNDCLHFAGIFEDIIDNHVPPTQPGYATTVVVKNAHILPNEYEINNAYVSNLGKQTGNFTWAQIKDENFRYIKSHFKSEYNIPVSITAEGEVSFNDGLFEMTPNEIEIKTTPKK